MRRIGNTPVFESDLDLESYKKLRNAWDNSFAVPTSDGVLGLLVVSGPPQNQRYYSVYKHGTDTIILEGPTIISGPKTQASKIKIFGEGGFEGGETRRLVESLLEKNLFDADEQGV